MHGSVMQNKKYIKFAHENTVEVLALSRLDEAIQKGERRAGTYKARDENGNEVQCMVEWPGLTADQIRTLHSSPAARYNKTGKIPYTSIVDPHTLKEMEGFLGGQSSKTIMEAVKTCKKELKKQYGPSLSRKVLDKLRKAQAVVRSELSAGKLARGLADVAKLEKSMAKQPQKVLDEVAKIKAEAIEAAGKRLDELEAQIDGGEAKQVIHDLGPLIRALKGTDLFQRATDLLAKAKS